MATFFNQATLSYSGGTVNSNIATGEIVEALSITKTAVSDIYEPGSDITYVIQIINSSDTAFSGLTLTDDLGAYSFGANTLVPLTYNDGSIRFFINGDLVPTPTVTADDELTVSGINIPANSIATLVYTVSANEFAPLAQDGTIENTATLNGNLAAPLSASETVAAEIGPNLQISKAISPAVVSDNGRVTYTLTITNNGNESAEIADNIIVSDIFDPILTDIVVSYNSAAWTQGVNYTYNETTGEFTTLPAQITVPQAIITQDISTGAYSIEPGVSIITITGTI